MSDMDPTDEVKCKWCDTMVEWTQGGQRWLFTAHTDEFCRDATRQLVQDLKIALRSMQETCEHATRRNARRVHDYDYLQKHGLPTEEEKGAAILRMVEAKRLVQFTSTDLGESFE